MEIFRRRRKLKKNGEVLLTGRPCFPYTEEIGNFICEQISHGKTMTSICKKEGMPSIATIYSWLSPLNPHYNEEFLKSYLIAREIQAEVLADEIKDISDEFDKKDDGTKVNRARLRTENRKWLAAHLLPRKFSDRMQLTGADGKDLFPATPTKIVFNFVDEKKEQ
jgi:hypothetical protein